jgi:ankyrin repeat protein
LALETAAGTNQVEIVKYLLEAGADPNQGVFEAKITYNEEILRLLIEAGASVTE